MTVCGPRVHDRYTSHVALHTRSHGLIRLLPHRMLSPAACALAPYGVAFHRMYPCAFLSPRSLARGSLYSHTVGPACIYGLSLAAIAVIGSLAACPCWASMSLSRIHCYTPSTRTLYIHSRCTLFVCVCVFCCCGFMRFSCERARIAPLAPGLR